MLQPAATFLPLTGVDYDRTLVLAIELSSKNWVLAAQVPGLLQTKARRTIEPTKEALFEALHGYHARAVAAGRQVERVVAIYEAGWSGFWLARWLKGTVSRSMSSSPRASQRTDACVGRSRMASMPSCCCAHCWHGFAASPASVRWCRSLMKPTKMRGGLFGNGRTGCRAGRFRQPGRCRSGDAGRGDYNPLLQSRRRRLDELRTGLGEPLPPQRTSQDRAPACQA